MPDSTPTTNLLSSAASHQQASFSARFRQYLAERFPLAAYVPLIGVAAFCAAAWSSSASGAALPPALTLVVGAATALAFFFVLRVADEHKDAEQDRRARPELPVPRGLVTLRELRTVAAAVGMAVLVVNALVAPRLLYALVPAVLWAGLMAREFFVPEWLRARPLPYLLSHMLVMPLLFAYLTGLDWLARRGEAPPVLPLFLVVAFLNGILVEIGRKVRAPADERPGVDTYTSAWGTRRAPAAWLAALLVAAVVAPFAAGYAGADEIVLPLAGVLAAAAAVPALRFLRRPAPASARQIELASGLWTLASYLLLGISPLIAR
ncbi:MAG TPA: UbiA family prenyltransferase [Longimicrobium sp.]|nr:UbiA family prenyltransferase [Longimicrobium sp.]